MTVKKYYGYMVDVLTGDIETLNERYAEWMPEHEDAGMFGYAKWFTSHKDFVLSRVHTASEIQKKRAAHHRHG